MWNPLKAEGAIHLDLSRREERQVVRMLVVLNYIGEFCGYVNEMYSFNMLTCLASVS